MQTFQLVGEIFYFVVSLAYFLHLYLDHASLNWKWPFRKPRPQDIRTRQNVTPHPQGYTPPVDPPLGACGATGCKIRKPHSHVIDLCDRNKGR